MSTKFNQLSRKTYANNYRHFHGTGISVFQHFDNFIEKESITYNYEKERNFELPLLYYDNINPVSRVKIQFPILTTSEYPKNITVNPVLDSLEWLKFLHGTNSTNAKASEKSCNWAVHFQEKIASNTFSSVLLPFINESINSPAMLKHCMTVIQDVVHKVNSGQIPIIISLPVYALLKQIERNFSNDLNDAFIVMMGGLLIEMVMFHVLGLMLLGPNL